ncbi:MAG TPA: hypothetical protein VGB42_04175 [Candidatus Thermoplasmatota archaeon]
MLVAVAVIASLVLLALGAFMTLMSVHGPDVLGWLGPPYTVAALMVLVWRARALARSPAGHPAFRLGLVAVALVGAGGLIAGGAVVWDDWNFRRHAALAARIEVLDVTDEPLLGPAGHPLGIRVRFSLRVPKSGRWSLDPYLRFEEGPSLGVVAWVAASRAQGAGPPAPGPVPDWFEVGTTYGVEYDIVPSFLGMFGAEAPPSLCLRRLDPVTEAPGYAWMESLQTTAAGTLLLDIGETSYRARPLSHSYPYRALFEGAVRERLPDCPTLR